MTEALALQFACLEAARLGFSRVHLEGDCLCVINAVLGKGVGLWEIDLVVSDIRTLLSNFQEVRISHVFREANSAADKVAGLGHLSLGSGLVCNPDFMSIVRKDAIGG